MKKAIVSELAFLLAFCCVPALSQETEESVSNIPEVSVIARLDANPVIPLSDEAKVPFDPVDFFGASCLATLVDGSIGEHFAYSFAFNWLSTEPRSIYVMDLEDGTSKANLFYSGSNNFLNWANVSFLAGGFELKLGKDVLALGSMEYDEYDFDIFWDRSSYFWQNYAGYQWGASVGYTLPDEANTLTFQFQSSPFGERTFASNLFTYSLQWKAEYDWGRFIYSTNFLQYDVNSYLNLIGLGHEFYLGDFTVRLDYMNRAVTPKNFFKQEQAVNLHLTYNYEDKVEAGIWGAGDFIMHDRAFFTEEEDLGNLWSAGAIVKWYPLKESQDLRVHGLVGYNNYLHEGGLSINLGITYNFNITNLFTRNK